MKPVPIFSPDFSSPASIRTIASVDCWTMSFAVIRVRGELGLAAGPHAAARTRSSRRELRMIRVYPAPTQGALAQGAGVGVAEPAPEPCGTDDVSRSVLLIRI